MSSYERRNSMYANDLSPMVVNRGLYDGRIKTKMHLIEHTYVLTLVLDS